MFEYIYLMVSNSQVRWYSMYSIARINNRDITDLVRILLFEYYATHFMVPAIYLGIIVYRTQLIFAQTTSLRVRKFPRRAVGCGCDCNAIPLAQTYMFKIYNHDHPDP